MLCIFSESWDFPKKYSHVYISVFQLKTGRKRNRGIWLCSSSFHHLKLGSYGKLWPILIFGGETIQILIRKHPANQKKKTALLKFLAHFVESHCPKISKCSNFISRDGKRFQRAMFYSNHSNDWVLLSSVHWAPLWEEDYHYSAIPSPWKQSLSCACFPKAVLMIRSMNVCFTGSATQTSVALRHPSLRCSVATLANLFWFPQSWHLNSLTISIPNVVKIIECLEISFVCLSLIWISLPLNGLIKDYI